MRAAVFYGGADIRVEDVPRPAVGPGDVLVEVRAAGVCGSDLHRYRGLDPWGPSDPGPRRAGHELAGVVAETGPGVVGLEEGQPVAVEPMQLAGCGECPPCRRGENNLCRRRAHATRRWTSAGFAEFDVAAVEHVHPIPDALPVDVAALADVYACAVHALHRVTLGPESRVVVIGTGSVGLALGQLARASGARRTIVVGRRPEALETAVRVGAADATIDGRDVDDLGPLVAGLTDGEGASAVFEVVGGEGSQTLKRALDAATTGGTIGVLGAFVGDVEIPYREANRKEIDLRWCNGYGRAGGRSDFRAALEWLASGRVDGAGLITHRFALDDIQEAFRAADAKARSNAIKVLIEPRR